MARPSKNRTSSLPKGRYLRHFTLESVRTFRSPVSLDFCHPDGRIAQWTVILGENGTGKTTLLQYLAGMMPVIPGMLPARGAYSDDNEIRVGPMFSRVEWESWHCSNLPKPFAARSIDANLVLSEPTQSLRGRESLRNSDADLSLSVYFDVDGKGVPEPGGGSCGHVPEKLSRQLRLFGYGASRHVAGAASPYLSSETFFSNGGGEPTSTLFHDDYPLISPEQWLLGLDHTSRSEGRAAHAAKRAYESARRCIRNILPGISEVRVKQQKGSKGMSVMTLTCRTCFGEVPFSALSIGYRTMAAWLIDFVKRMHEAFPDLEEPDDGPAIVLIDEFDLHMHPKWQREAMTALSQEFPNTQFIVTAHSPLIVQAAGGDAKVVVLRRQQREDGFEEVIVEDHPHQAHGWRVEQILEALYGVSPRSPRYEELMRERVRLRQKEKLSASEKRRLTETEAELDRLEPAEEVSASQQLLSDLKNALEAASGSSRRQQKS